MLFQCLNFEAKAGNVFAQLLIDLRHVQTFLRELQGISQPLGFRAQAFEIRSGLQCGGFQRLDLIAQALVLFPQFREFSAGLIHAWPDRWDIHHLIAAYPADLARAGTDLRPATG